MLQFSEILFVTYRFIVHVAAREIYPQIAPVHF